MGLAFAQAMFKQKVSVADLSAAARETALANGAAVAYDPSEADIARRIIKENDGGFDAVVDFAGSEKSLNFAVSTVARGGKIVVSGLVGGPGKLIHPEQDEQMRPFLDSGKGILKVFAHRDFGDDVAAGDSRGLVPVGTAHRAY